MKRQKETSKGLEEGLARPTQASAEVVFSNEDLLYEILLRVPARSLVRFKCVSKYWLVLISDTKFGYNHTTQNRKSISALYFYMGSLKCDGLKSASLCGHQSLPTLSFLSGVETNRNIEVSHMCNGLTLCTYDPVANDTTRTYQLGGFVLTTPNYIIANLTTQKYVIISQPTWREGFINASSLAYDPAVSSYYKIVSFGRFCFDSFPIDIYSSEKSSWTRVQALELTKFPMKLTAFFNGSVHWMTSDSYFRLEVETEKLTKTLMPLKPRIISEPRIRFFGECGGNLLLVQYASPYVAALRIFQWEMETGHWILKQRASLRTIREAFPDERIRFNLLTILEGSLEGDIILVLHIEGKVIAFYPNCNKFKVIRDTPEGFSLSAHLQKGGAYHHFESLSPV